MLPLRLAVYHGEVGHLFGQVGHIYSGKWVHLFGQVGHLFGQVDLKIHCFKLARGIF